MSAGYEDLCRLWLEAYPDALLARGNDVGTLVEGLGLDDAGFHRFTSERGIAMRAAAERNGLDPDTSHGVAVTHGFLLGLLLGRLESDW